MYHYVYLLYRSDIIERVAHQKPCLYFGVRKSTKNPIDDPYLSSSKYIKKEIKEGVKFRKIIVQLLETREDALFYEKLIVDSNWINSPYTYNLTIGGNSSNEYQMGKLKQNKKKFFELGGKVWNDGLKYSDETKDYFRQIRIDYLKNNPEFIMVLSNSIKKLWQDITYVKKQNNLEYLRTDEIQNKRLKTMRETMKTKEYKDKRSKINKELWADPEYMKKQNNLEYLRTDEVKNKRIKTLNITVQQPEYKDKRSKINKELWADPEYMKKQNNLEYLRTDEVRKKISETLKQKVKTHTCSVCGHVGRGPWMFQQHFERCKFKNEK